MGIQINGSTDTISAVDGSLSIEGGELRTVSGINVTGVVTATSYQGDGSALTGIAATANVRTGILDVAGVGTFRSDVNVPDSIIHLGDTDTKIRFPAADTVTVETGGSERARIDSSGRLLVGTATARSNIAGIAPAIQLEGANDNTPRSFGQIYGKSDAAGPLFLLAKHRSDSVGGQTVVSSGDELGQIVFTGSDGSNFVQGASIKGAVDGTPGTNDMPGRLVFSTTADGASSPTERLRISANGNIEASGQVQLTDGSAGSPGLTFKNDGSADTGIFRPGSDTFGFTTGGTERARIDSSGRLLIGRTASQNENIEGVGYANLVQIEGSATGSGLSVANNAAAARINISRDIATGSITNNMPLGFISFGAESTTTVERARIQCDAEFTNANERGGRLKFYTSADGQYIPSERMRITQAGFTKMFTTSVHSATSPYHEIGNKNNVSGDVDLVLLLGGSNTNNTSSYFVKCADSVNDRLYIYGNGNVVNSNNSYGSLSDVKLKENIVDANSQWSDIKALQVRNYNFIEGSTHTQIGVVAQEVELVSPGLVSESPDTDDEGNDLGTVTKSVNYSVLYMKSVKALQEAMERIETLETANASQAATIAALDARLTALEGGN